MLDVDWRRSPPADLRRYSMSWLPPVRVTCWLLLLAVAVPSRSSAAPNPDCLSGFYEAPFSGIRLRGEPWSAIEIDFDHDGDLDVAVASITHRYNDDQVLIFETVVAFLRRGTNGTVEADPFELIELGTGDLADRAGDLDGDGLADIVLAMNSRGEAHIIVYYGLATGGFERVDLGSSALLQTIGVVISDVNLDGRDDLLCTSYFPASALLVASRGRGEFEDVRSFPFSTGGGYATLAASDFNSDGVPDFAYGGSGGSIRIRLGRGDGDFNAAPDLEFPSTYLDRLKAVDLTGDGKLDLAGIGYGDFCDQVLTAEDSTVYIYPGRGDGSFDSPRALVAGYTPTDLAVGDLNGDGRADVAVGLGDRRGGICYFANHAKAERFPGAARASASIPLVTQTGFPFGRVATFIATDDGSLRAAGSYPAGSGVNHILVAQGDCDAPLDVLALDADQYSVTTLPGNGDGSLGHERSFSASLIPRGVCAVDLDRDGRSEAVLANWAGNAVSVYSGLAAGSGGRRTDYPAGPAPNSVVVADFDNDHVKDLAVACFGSADSSWTCESTGGGIAILRGDGAGGFEAPRFIPLDARSNGLAVGDLNRDGAHDLISTVYGPCGGMYALLGRGDLTFEPIRILDQAMPRSAWLADVNRDGTLDIIANVYGTPYTMEAIGLGDGSFAPPVSLTNVSQVLGVEDWNGDGIADLYGAGAYLGRGDGTFEILPASFPGQDYLGSINGATSGDFDGDGRADLATWEWAGSTVLVRFGNGDGTFIGGVRYGAGWGPSGVGVGDVDGDGRRDLIASNELSHTLAVLINRKGTPVTLPATAFVVGESRTIPVGCASAELRCRLQPAAAAFELDQLDLASLRLESPDTGRVPSIPALISGESRTGDSNRDGIVELEVRFRSEDLGALFSTVRGRTTLQVGLRGSLLDGRSISANFGVTVRGKECRPRASVFPNPLNPVGVLRFSTESPGPIVVRIFDVQGRLVAVPLSTGFTAAGEHEVQLGGVGNRGLRLPSGVYAFRIDSAGGQETGRFAILK